MFDYLASVREHNTQTYTHKHTLSQTQRWFYFCKFVPNLIFDGKITKLFFPPILFIVYFIFENTFYRFQFLLVTGKTTFLSKGLFLSMCYFFFVQKQKINYPIDNVHIFADTHVSIEKKKTHQQQKNKIDVEISVTETNLVFIYLSMFFHSIPLQESLNYYQ